MGEKIPRRMRRFYRNPQQEEEQFDRGFEHPEKQGESPEELMGENIFSQLRREEEFKKPVGAVPKQDLLKKPEAMKIAVNKVEEFKGKYRRFPRKDEYDQIAESIFEQLKTQEMKQFREQGGKGMGAAAIPTEPSRELSRAERLAQRRGKKQETPRKESPKQILQETEKPLLKEIKELEIKDVLGESEESIESLEEGLGESEEGTEQEFSLAGLETGSEEKKCPNCKKKVEELIFCPNCGNAFCEQCAKIERIGSEKKIFCPKCGKEIKK